MAWLDWLRGKYGRDAGTSPNAVTSPTTSTANPAASSSAQASSNTSPSLLTQFFSNAQPPQTAGTNTHKPTSGTVNFVVTITTFFIFIYVLAIEIWLIVNSAQSANGSIEVRSRSSQASQAGATTSRTHSQALYSFSITKTDTKWSQETKYSDKTSDIVFYALPESTTEVGVKRARRATSLAVTPVAAATASRHQHRALSKPNSAFQEKVPTCLYHPGSQLPNAGGGTALAVCILYDVWIVVFILSVMAYEQKRLRYDRSTHSASVVGLMEFWLASDVLVRGVEVQLQLAAILLILTALPNLWYGLPETYRQRDKLFALLLARADWATSRPGAVGPGLPGPSGPGASAAQTGAPPAGAPAPASGAAPGAVPPQASGGPPGATAGAPPGLAPTAPAAPPIVLPEKDLIATNDLPAYVYDTSLLTGLSGAEIKERFGEIPEEVRKALPGGIPDYRNRQLTMEEMMYKAMFDSGGGASGGASGGTGAGTGGGAVSGGGGMDRMMMMMMMQQMFGGGAFGSKGGMMQQQQPPGPSGSMSAFPQQNAYGPGGYAQNLNATQLGTGPLAGGDSALARLMQKEAAKNALQQQFGV